MAGVGRGGAWDAKKKKCRKKLFPMSPESFQILAQKTH